MACAQTTTQQTPDAPVADRSVAGEFKLKPETEGPIKKRERIDVNLGQTPEAFVRAAYAQINGSAPL